MPERLEADIALLNVVDGRPVSAEPPGLAYFAAPRKAARGRERDLLCLCLGLRSRTPLAAERAAELHAELLQLAAATYFGTPGSVTAAARQAVAAVNRQLLDHNLREGTPMQGGLCSVALRGQDLYAVQCGPGALVVAHPESVERFPAAAGRPLGLSDVLDAQYFHTTVRAGDYLALSPAAAWTPEALAGLGSLATLSAAAERLKDAAGRDLQALVARFEPEGALTVTPPTAPGAAPAAAAAPLPALPSLSEIATRLRPAGRPGPEPAPAPSAPETIPPAETAEAPAAPPPEAAAAAPASTDWQELLRRTDRWRVEDQPGAPPTEPPGFAATRPGPAVAEEAAEAEGPAPFERASTRTRERAGAGLGQAAARVRERAAEWGRSLGRAVGVTLTEAARSLRRLMARALPEGALQRDGLFMVPPSVLIGVAVGMPLLVVAVAAIIYLQRGVEEEYASALLTAQTEVTSGRLAADPLAARPNWEAALQALEQAERLRPGQPQVAQLRQEAQARLDELDWVVRLDYVPLIPTGLGPNVELQAMTLVGRDVYALDAAQKRVWRLAANPSGVYSVDDTFQCASGPIGQGMTIGALIDIGFVPGPNVRDGDAVIALDSVGGLLYCAPGEAPLGSYLPAPDTGWVQPIGMELFNDSLYVLDIGRNQLWQYPGAGGVFNQPPAGYFSSVVYDLKDVVDFTIAGGDLMLLRRDGRIAICSRAQAFDTATCVETAQFTDQRPGRQNGERLADAPAPTRLLYDQPPEPSVIMLDPADSSLIQLSLKLVFARQFRPARPLGAPISAVAVDLSKRFFVATRDNVYVASRP